MVAISGLLIFAGYQLATYGWSQVRGSNAGFFDILWPGRFAGLNPDKSATAPPTAPSTQPSQGSAGSKGGATGTGTGAIGSSGGPLVH